MLIAIENSEVQRLVCVANKLNKLLRKHKNKLIGGHRLLKGEDKYQGRRIKYLLFFKVFAFGKSRYQLIHRVDSLNALVCEVEVFASSYKKQLKLACG